MSFHITVASADGSVTLEFDAIDVGFRLTREHADISYDDPRTDRRVSDFIETERRFELYGRMPLGAIGELRFPPDFVEVPDVRRT
jgi:hypothetical protein